MTNTAISSLQNGITILKQALQTIPDNPGVYRMLDKRGNPLYVGKAKNLVKRVASYTHPERLNYRIQLMVSHITTIEVVTTETEAEALLLEANLIKRLQPRYNILLRDDKSFPYIALSTPHPFNRVFKHRGTKEPGAEYFGPFASAGDVNEAITQLQKIFLLRPCTDDYFAGRKRPCLQYQIKRCSAPCVQKINEADYQEQIQQAHNFLSGKSHEVQKRLAQLMDTASEAMDYEKAARYRDRIKALTHIQAKQHINLSSLKDADVIALHREEDSCCIQIFFFRAGHNYGNKSYFPLHTEESSDADILSAFIGQFYQSHPAPEKILLSHSIGPVSSLEQALKMLSGSKVSITHPRTGDGHQALLQAIENAKEALRRKRATLSSHKARLSEIQLLFSLPEVPHRIEVYDNSHIMGSHAVGAMIVSGEEGFIKEAYRRFNVTATNGDDYAMMKEMLKRRLSRLQSACPEPTRGIWPDLLLIDGGAGHLHSALQVLQELGITAIACAAIAKGPERNAGKEQFFLAGTAPFTLDKNEPVMRYLQILRDEAHRFAIGGHRAKRAKTTSNSRLDDIPTIGATRKKALLHYFGSVKDIEQAPLEDLLKVEGINKITAQAIYDYLHAGK